MSYTHTLQSTLSTTYEVHTPIFEGPLDLLLQLIEKNELDITKVALAQVTDQFLDHVERMRANAQIEIMADFLAVAAKLLWIKSKALLPKPPASAQEAEDEEDVGDELVRQLRAYRQYKEAASWLRERDHRDLRSYVRAGLSPRPKQITLDLSNVTLEKLRDFAENALFPTDKPRPEGAIQKPRISIAQQIGVIRDRLKRWTRITFQQLLSHRPTRLEAVVTLQAVLELIKQEIVVAYQEKLFGDITIRKAGSFPAELVAGEGSVSPSGQ
jgi:segregation and condensation protein A